MAINWHRPEYEEEVGRWQLVDDMCEERNLDTHIESLDTLKSRTVMADADGRTWFGPEEDRNAAFKRRASFYGASRMTLEGLIGVAFERDPQITLPAGLDYLLTNVDGCGSDIWQQMQEAVGEALKKARGGLYVTMPQTDGNASLADQEALRSVATINLIEAKRIINWWTRTDGAETYLAGVVFTDKRETVKDYEIEAVETCRELALDEAGNFFDRTWVQKDGGKWEAEAPVYPRDGSAQMLRRIPFLFFGARRNHWGIQVPPMLSLARKNRDHLRNSAINEEGIWFSGHIQPAADEMDPEAVDVIHKGGFKIGGGQLIVAKGFRFEVAEPNSAARQGMLDKAEEMAALGAMMLRPGTVAKTATEAANDMRVLHSVLSLVTVNIEDAYQWAIERCAKFMNVTGQIEVKMNRAFMDPVITAEKMRDLRESLLSGVIGPAEMFLALQRAGDIDPDKTQEEYEAELATRGLIGGQAREDDANTEPAD